MSQDRYEVAGYDPAFKSQLLELQRHMWGTREDLNAKYFQWKYESNPYVRAPQIFVALHDGRPVAMRGMLGSRWEAGAPRAAETILCAADTVVDPAHRDRGLFTRIMDFALADLVRKDFSYLFSLSTSPATRLGSLASGWRGTGPLPEMGRGTPSTRRTRLWDAVRRASDKVLPGRRRPFARLDRFLTRSTGRFGQGMTVATAPRPEAMADLIDRVGHDGRIRHVRDTTYLAWRFQNPNSTYRFCFLDQDQLRGYIVLQARPYSSASDIVRIVDWEGETAAARRAVAETALGDLVGGPARVASVSLSPEDRATLLHVGFRDRRTKSAVDQFATILVRPVSPAGAPPPWLFGGRELTDATNWDLRPIYSDGS